MEIVREKTVGSEVGAELELQQTVETSTLGPAAGIVPKHYNFQEDSSEEDDQVLPPTLPEGNGDCVCCVCGKTFTFLNKLIEHFSVHKDEVRCHLCQVTFTRVISLALHLENAHPKYNLFCKSCKTACRNTWHLNQHMEKHFQTLQNHKGNKVTKPKQQTPSEEQKPLDEDIEEVVIKSEEVEIKCLKEEEEEVALEKMQETKENGIMATTEEDHTVDAIHRDHNYCVSDDAPAHNTRSSARAHAGRLKDVSNKALRVFNSSADIKDTKESEGHQEKVKVVALHSVQPRKDMTEACRAILQATNKKELKSQKLGVKPQIPEQEVPPRSSLSCTPSAGLELAELELDIKVEDEDEENFWECAPIEEDMKEEEEDIEIKEEGDPSPIDDSLDAPKEDSNSQTDTDTAYSMDYSTDSSEKLSLKRNDLEARSLQKRQTHTNGNEINVVKTLETVSSKETPPHPAKVNVGPEPSRAIAKPLSSVKANVGPVSNSTKDPLICSSCGLSKAPSIEKPMEKCKCQMIACYMCGAMCESDQLLLKHQAENHPLTKYICSSCLQVFPNQKLFMKHSCCSKLPTGQPQSRNANNVKTPKMILKFVPSGVGGSSKQSIGRTASSLNILSSNNLVNNSVASQKHNSTSNSVLPQLSSKSPSDKTSLAQARATKLNVNQDMTSLVIKGGQNLVTTTAKTGQTSIPSSSSAIVKPTAAVLQGSTRPRQRPVLKTNPICVPVCVSLPVSPLDSSTAASHQSKIALRIPTYPSTSTKVQVSFSPTSVQLPTPAVGSVSGMKTVPSTSRTLVRPVTIPLPKPPSAPGSTPADVNLQGSCRATSTVQVPPSSDGPLKIVAMFVNQSQEVALQKRLRQSWRCKTNFPCRRCGAIARQPALAVRHRYQHRGPRLHRCQCGRTFQQQLHLLRHQVQHAESVRYICAACGQTFRGTRRLACHKQRKLFRVMSSSKKNDLRECRNSFHCGCGQAFSRSSALLWHMLKNSRSYKRLKKALLI